MLDALVERAREAGVQRIIGYYIRTPKNAMVEQHYGELGFHRESAADDNSPSTWSLSVPAYQTRGKHIKVKALIHG